MKQTDLMLNDLVLVRVFSQQPTYEIRRVDLDLLSRFDRLQVEPIKLTPGILEIDIDAKELSGYKINFRHQSTTCYSYYDLEIEFCSELLLMMHDIKYVHEVQHAMRLCGLNELTDNLKLTKGE